jgi:hypothetical protein
MIRLLQRGAQITFNYSGAKRKTALDNHNAYCDGAKQSLYKSIVNSSSNFTLPRLLSV